MGLRRKHHYIVAIGASAGGLEALLELLPNLAHTGDTRFVLAQHMAKTGHTELVVRVLARHSALPVAIATDGEPMLAGTLYVIPAGTDGIIEQGRILLRPPRPDGHSAPSVNVLLSSVARDVGDDAVAVVLSGAGSDGVVGCRDVRQAGGSVLVQEAGSSAIHGMAGAILREGLADEVLTPEGLASRINALTPKPSLTAQAQHPGVDAAPMTELLQLLSAYVGVDFTQYRQGTLLRRMDRRREAQGFADLDAYIAHALDTPSELDVLHRMFMISWSWFFRDAAAWERLCVELRASLDSKPVGEEFVAWVPGCAAGEEAYTVAMILRELDPDRPVRVIGSDINLDAIDAARAGRYPHKALREMPTRLRERFMVEEAESARVADEVRALCSFRVEDVLKQAPSEPLDLVSCRNVLIYMRHELQVPLLHSIHDHLRPNGLLFLGHSESLNREESRHWRIVDSGHRIYTRQG